MSLNKENLCNIVIPAYIRSDLLEKRVSEIIDWNGLDTLFLSIDGLRSEASSFEISSYESTMLTAEKLARKYIKIQVKERKSNQGLTNHAKFIFSNCFGTHNELIILEEDTSISHAGLDFLINFRHLEKVGAVSAYSRRKHNVSSPQFRTTLFPEQWGVSINKRVAELFVEISESGIYDQKMLRNMFHENFAKKLSFLKTEKILHFWKNHFFFSTHNKDHADAIIQLAVISGGYYYLSPLNSFVNDDALIEDRRSLNIRNGNIESFLCHGRLSYLPEYQPCVECEMDLSKLKEISYKTIIGGLRHKRRLLGSQFARFSEDPVQFRH